jgi:acetyl-CoA carboxylase biotin carboxylase subunit
MIAKIITHGADRSEAIRKMCLALDETVIVGTQSNIPLHKMLLKDPLINQGSVDIHYLETLLGAADNHEEEVA